MRGSALWWARRVVLGVRLGLGVLAVVSGVVAARAEDTDAATSNRWTVVMLGAVVGILLGGLVWWVEPGTPPGLRTRERLRTVGRWVRALLASAGVGLGSYWAILDEQGLVRGAVVVFLLSPVAYLVFVMIGNAVNPPVWVPTAVDDEPLWWRRRQERARALVAPAWENLVAAGGRRSALAIRPRSQPGVPVPAGLVVWLRDAALSTDGVSLTVTGRRGKAFRVPLAGAGQYGAAGLLVVRETVVASSQYGRSVPRLRELLCVLDSAGRRMVDIELYGWTRTDLVALARAAGLRLDRYAPQERQGAVANLRGQTPTALDQAVPRAATHRTVRGRSPWRDVPAVVAIVLVTVAGYFGVSYAFGEMSLPDPWLTITACGVGVAMVGLLVFAVRRLASWHEQRRQAVRARFADAP